MPCKKKKSVSRRPKPKQKGKGAYDYVANKLFGANLKDGEIHAPQWTKDGLKFGSYIGPGTSLQHNLKTGKMPVSKTDTVSQMHDIQYGLATNPAEVRAADHRMLNSLDRLAKNKSDYRFNIGIGKMPIRLKMFAEDMGLIKPGSFSSQKGNTRSPEEKKILLEHESRLKQEGYGKKKTTPWMTHVASVRKKHPGTPYKECLKIASKSYKKK